MERRTAEILRDAPALPAEGRAGLIDSLIDSLDQTVDQDAEEAWKCGIYLHRTKPRPRLTRTRNFNA
jgi:hypothetical protein